MVESIATKKSSPVSNLFTVRQLIERHPFLREGGLRWALFHRHRNGLEACIKHLGRKILIDEEAFFDWLDGRDASPLSSPALAQRETD